MKKYLIFAYIIVGINIAFGIERACAQDWVNAILEFAWAMTCLYCTNILRHNYELKDKLHSLLHFCSKIFSDALASNMTDNHADCEHVSDSTDNKS